VNIYLFNNSLLLFFIEKDPRYGKVIGNVNPSSKFDKLLMQVQNIF